MTHQITTNPTSLSPAERAALLADWSAKNRARKAEQERLQQRQYFRTLDGDSANALEQAFALHNGDDAGSIDDAARLAVLNRDIQFWSAAVGQLHHLVAKDHDAATAAANIAVKPEYLKRLRALADACEATWDAFVAVAAVGDSLRSAGHAPSSTILPGAPLSFLGALNPNNPQSQISEFKRILATH
jgi:hypothetical protein